MVERAAVSELAIAGLLPELAGGRLVVREDRAEGSLSELLWQWVVGLSQVLRAVRELAKVFKWAIFAVQVVLAKLSFVLELQLVDLALSLVELLRGLDTAQLLLLLQVTQHLVRRVVEVARPSVRVGASSLVAALVAVGLLGILRAASSDSRLLRGVSGLLTRISLNCFLLLLRFVRSRWSSILCCAGVLYFLVLLFVVLLVCSRCSLRFLVVLCHFR